MQGSTGTFNVQPVCPAVVRVVLSTWTLGVNQILGVKAAEDSNAAHGPSAQRL